MELPLQNILNNLEINCFIWMSVFFVGLISFLVSYFFMIIFIHIFSILATCALDVIQYSILKSMKFIYFENEQVTIRCKRGFMLEGKSMLKCGLDGEWNYETPKCAG